MTNKIMEIYDRTYRNCEFYLREGKEMSLANEIGVLRGIAYCMEEIGIGIPQNFYRMIEIQQELKEKDQKNSNEKGENTMTMYGIIDMSETAFIEKLEDADKKGYEFNYEYCFKSSDEGETVAELKRINANDDTHCIEIFEADEDGDFVSGSDYDEPSSFIKDFLERM